MMFKCHRKLAIVTAILLITSISNPQGFLNNSYATPFFELPITHTTDNLSFTPAIATSGSNTYVVWQDATFNISFMNITDDGTIFGPITPLSIDGASSVPQIATSGSNTYVVWQDATFNISFMNITDDGTIFGPITPLSIDGASSVPQIATSGSNTYVVWQDGTGNISFMPITDDGTTFGPITPLTTTGTTGSPDVAASLTNNIYVVWHDFLVADLDVLFTNTIDSGSTFSLPADLSGNTGGSAFPKVDTFDSNVY